MKSALLQILGFVAMLSDVQTKPSTAQELHQREAAESIRRERLDRARGWVTDSEHHLMWVTKESAALEWNLAKGYCRQLKTGGFNDWRLPTISELGDLFNHLYYYSTGSDLNSVPRFIAWSSTVDSSGKAQSLDLFPGHAPPKYVTDQAPSRFGAQMAGLQKASVRTSTSIGTQCCFGRRVSGIVPLWLR